jgi:hypothetical protein
MKDCCFLNGEADPFHDSAVLVYAHLTNPVYIRIVALIGCDAKRR